MRDQTQRNRTLTILVLFSLIVAAAPPTEARADSLVWSGFLGGTGFDEADCVCLDDEGLPVIAGRTRSLDFPAGMPSPQGSGGAGSEAFVAKFSEDGAALLWGRVFGGCGDDAVLAITPTGSGGLLVAGVTMSGDFPVTGGGFDLELDGPSDLFVLELDARTAAIRWCTFLGGSGLEMMRSNLHVDEAGHPIVTGSTSSPDFPTTPGVVGEDYGGGATDAFVAKLAADGSQLIWSSFLGGEESDLGLALASTPTGDLLVAGTTQSSGFPVTLGAFDTALGGGGDAFAVKLSADGSHLLWSGFLGGDDPNAHEEISAITCDAAGNPVVAGVTSSEDFPTTEGAYDRSPGGGLDGFCAGLSAAGDRLLWSTLIGGGGDDRIKVLAMDQAGRSFLVGSSGSLDYPTTPTAYSRTHAGGETDAILSRLDPVGADLLWSSFLGGGGDDFAFALTPLESEAYLLAGLTDTHEDIPFPSTAGAYDEKPNGGGDAFLCKFTLPTSTSCGSGELSGPGLLLLPYRPDVLDSRLEIRYVLPQAGPVSLTVFDPRGRRVRRLLHSQSRRAGEHALAWDGCDDAGKPLATGVYLVRLRSGNDRVTRKIAILK